jgi:anti-anti-sigma factor
MSTENRERDSVNAATPLVEIVVGEDLTASAATRLDALLNDALALRPAQLVVDLARCSYADAHALDVLLNAHRKAWHMGGRLTLRAPTPRVQRLLQLSHVDQVFNVTPAAPSPRRPPKAVGSLPPVVR